jgi:hypothetical protein
MVLPKRAIVRTDKVEPICRKSSTEATEPALQQFRRETAEPKFAKRRTEHLAESLVNSPRNDNELPSDKKSRADTEPPRRVEERTLIALPSKN